MKYAIIGCGRISELHIFAAKKNGLEIVALCDLVYDKARTRAEQSGLANAKIYNDYKEMLKAEKPELVAVTTDSGAHAAVAIDALCAGCNVIIEKPMALDMADARKICALAKETGLKVCACHQNRFNKSIKQIRDAVEDGKFGKLLHGSAYVRWNRDDDYYSQADWRGKWKSDGGALMNQSIHDIDLLRWMMGPEIDEVYAYTDRLSHNKIEAEDFGAALVKFTNGSYGIIEGTTNVYREDLEEKLVIFGTKGTAKAGGTSCNALEVWDIEGENRNREEVMKQALETPPNVYGFGHNSVYADMIDSIANNREPYITAKDGMDALELVLAIYLSAAENRPVKLPLGNISSSQFNGRFDGK